MCGALVTLTLAACAAPRDAATEAGVATAAPRADDPPQPAPLEFPAWREHASDSPALRLSGSAVPGRTETVWAFLAGGRLEASVPRPRDGALVRCVLDLPFDLVGSVAQAGDTPICIVSGYDRAAGQGRLVLVELVRAPEPRWALLETVDLGAGVDPISCAVDVTGGWLFVQDRAGACVRVAPWRSQQLLPKSFATVLTAAAAAELRQPSWRLLGWDGVGGGARVCLAHPGLGLGRWVFEHDARRGWSARFASSDGRG